MFFNINGCFIVTLLSFCLIENHNCEESGNFFLNAAKSVPRIGRNSNTKNNADFEKFFLKASKSVPRIGRRNQNEFSKENDQDGLNKINYPTWYEIADRYEYDPELFTSAELLAKIEEEMADDPSVYEWDKVRIKRTIPARFMFRRNN